MLIETCTCPRCGHTWDEGRAIESSEGTAAEGTAFATALGQVWSWRGHTLSIGDCRHLTIPADADTLLFDPPFQWDRVYEWMPPASDNRRIIVFSDAFRVAEAAAEMLAKGWQGCWEFVWDGCSSWYVPGRPLARHKVALIGWHVTPEWDFKAALYVGGEADTRRAGTINNGRGAYEYIPDPSGKHLSTVFVAGNSAQGDDHKHQKPAEWIRALLRGCRTSRIWDMCAGSCSWAVLADGEGWHYDGVEIDPEQAARALAGWKNVGDVPVLIDECATSVGRQTVDSDPRPGVVIIGAESLQA